MRSRRKRAALGAAGALSLAVMLAAISFAGEPSKLPTGEKVLDRYVEAIGGVKAFDKIENTVSKATMEIPAMGVKLDITVYAARPRKMYSRAESPMIGKVERGTDGEIFWEKSTMQGSRLLEGEELTDALRDATFEGLVYWRTLYDSVAVSGIDTVAGSPAYRVVMKAKGAKPRSYFFDRKSGLLVKTMSTIATQMGDIQAESSVGDYRKVGEVLQSHRTTVKIMGQDRIFTVSSIETNVSIPDSVFALPPDVRELLGQAKEGKKE